MNFNPCWCFVQNVLQRTRDKIVAHIFKLVTRIVVIEGSKKMRGDGDCQGGVSSVAGEGERAEMVRTIDLKS